MHFTVYVLNSYPLNKISNFRQHADFREDPDWQDHHLGGGAQRHHREREGQDPGQGGHPP